MPDDQTRSDGTEDVGPAVREPDPLEPKGGTVKLDRALCVVEAIKALNNAMEAAAAAGLQVHIELQPVQSIGRAGRMIVAGEVSQPLLRV